MFDNLCRKLRSERHPAGSNRGQDLKSVCWSFPTRDSRSWPSALRRRVDCAGRPEQHRARMETGKLPTITNLEAARRQIDFSIEQHFSQGDPFAIHTVIAAAFGILEPLAERSGNVGIHQARRDLIVPGKEAEFRSYVNHASNFLKHADRDPDARLEDVNEDINEPTIFVASLYYTDLATEISKPVSVDQWWYAALHPNLLTEEGRAQVLQRVPQERIDALLALPRRLHLRAGQELLKRATEKPGLRLPIS